MFREREPSSLHFTGDLFGNVIIVSKMTYLKMVNTAFSRLSPAFKMKQKYLLVVLFHYKKVIPSTSISPRSQHFSQVMSCVGKSDNSELLKQGEVRFQDKV